MKKAAPSPAPKQVDAPEEAAGPGPTSCSVALTACVDTKLRVRDAELGVDGGARWFGMLYGPLWRTSLLALSDLARRSP